MRNVEETTARAELLPCPFCHEQRVSLNAPSKWQDYGSINCPACMVVMPGAVSDQAELTQCWNTRPDREALLAALKQISTVCTDNLNAPNARCDMALGFVRQVAVAALSKATGAA